MSNRIDKALALLTQHVDGMIVLDKGHIIDLIADLENIKIDHGIAMAELNDEITLKVAEATELKLKHGREIGKLNRRLKARDAEGQTEVIRLHRELKAREA